MANSVERITQVWALDAAEFASVLADVDPSWGTEVFALAGGMVVLSGPGLFVNRALAVGQGGSLTEADWATLEDRSAVVGVPPAIEITPATHPAVVAAARDRGYVLDGVEAALARSLDLSHVPPPDPGFEVVPANRGLLPVWQETAACGWGHTVAAERAASDVFARVAAIVDAERFSLVRDAASGRPVGCASLTVRDGIATLGGMSTLPEERGRGVQTTLIRHRLRVAAAYGCDLATSVAVPDSRSERNLVREGFERVFTIERWVLGRMSS